jgi:hypothetical protein
MTMKFRPQPQQDAPVERRSPLISSDLGDSRLFPGWGPRV